MPVITEPEVQQWLETTKLDVPSVDTELELTARTMVFGKVGQSYDTTTWVDPASTPRLIRSAVAMLVAAWTYARAYSEDDSSTSGYAKWLESKALDLADSITSGTSDLSEVAGDPVSSGQPAFFPTDNTGTETALDDTGMLLEDSSARKFYMGSRF